MFALAALTTGAAAAEPGWIADPGTGCKLWNPNPQPDESIHWTGSCRDGLADGQGVLSWYGKDKSKEVEREAGGFRKGRMSGHGTQTFANGNKATGDFVEGRMNGRGTLIRANGERYTGSWRGGRWDGFGTLVWKNGDRYIGFWHDG